MLSSTPSVTQCPSVPMLILWKCWGVLFTGSISQYCVRHSFSQSHCIDWFEGIQVAQLSESSSHRLLTSGSGSVCEATKLHRLCHCLLLSKFGYFNESFICISRILTFTPKVSSRAASDSGHGKLIQLKIQR